MGTRTKAVSLAQTRPAEVTTPVAMAITMLIAGAIGVDDPTNIAYIAIVVSFVPAAVTYIVELIKAK